MAFLSDSSTRIAEEGHTSSHFLQPIHSLLSTLSEKMANLPNTFCNTSKEQRKLWLKGWVLHEHLFLES